jgi:hypothetical protein
LQAAFDRLPGSVAPPLKVKEAYVFHSLARAVKERVGGVGLVVVLDNFSDVATFMASMARFLTDLAHCLSDAEGRTKRGTEDPPHEFLVN